MPLKTLLHIGFRALVLFALNAPSRNFALKDHLGRPNRIHHPHALDSSGLDEQQGFSGSEGTPTRSAQNFNDKRSGSHGPPQRAPRYMQRLYEQYLTGEPVRSDSQVVDTVRNIVADLAIVKNSSIFIFNLSSVDEKEEVLKAEVHMYKRRSKPDPQTKEIGSITVQVYELGLGYLRQRASFHLPESGHARWHVFDVTPVIRSVAPGSRRDEAAADGMLAVSFEADDGSAAGGSRGANLRLSKVLRRFSRPSLVVFSRDNEEKHPGDGLDAVSGENEDDDDDEEDPNSEKESWRWNHDDQMRSRSRHPPVAAAGKHRIKVSARRSQQRNHPGSGLTPPERNHSAVDDDIFEMEPFSIPGGGGGQGHWMTLKGHELEEEIGGDGRVRFFHADLAPPGAVERNHVRGFLERSGRRNKREKRSINDNEVLQKEDETTEEEEEEEEEEPEVRFLYNALPETNPGILKGRRDSGRRRFPVTTASPILAFGEIGDDEDSAKQRRRKRKKEEERRARDRGSSLAVFVSRVGYQRRRGPSGRSDPSSSLPSSGACRKRELTVNFADIGWRDWIISPSSFEANYCDGSCLYPMASRLHPTNHATIQSIVNAIGLLERVPSPCCVPSSLSSVTLLYLDQNQNVVLKNFPDMTVRSCACR